MAAPSQQHPPTQPVESALVDPRLGTTLGKYRFLGRLGAGGMGVVYEALDTLLKRKVALKVLPSAVAAQSDDLKRFLLEAETAARLNHPNAVAIYEVDQRDGVYYIVMELVRGGSAAQRLEFHGPYPWIEAVRVVADACRGLAAAHAAQLIHRDIKPTNILCSPGGAKLADFGLAKATDQSAKGLTGAGHVIGTPNFMSPEQCRSEPVDRRSDVYSLGATFYTLLTGRPPYTAEGPYQVMFAHCSQPVPDPRAVNQAIPERCAAIARKAMAKSPDDRYPSADAFLADLTALLDQERATDPSVPNLSQVLRRPNATPLASPAAATVLNTDAMTQPPAPRSVPWPGWVGGGVLAVLLLAALARFLPRTAETTAKSEATAVSAALNQRPAGGFRARITEKGLDLPVDAIASAVTFAPDGSRLAIGTDDGVRVFDLASGAAGPTLWPKTDIRCVAWSPDSQTVAAGTSGGGVKVARLGDGRDLTLPVNPDSQGSSGANVRALAFAPDGRTLAAGLSPWGTEPFFLHLWTSPGWTELARSRGHSKEVWSLSFSADGQLLATGANDGTVKLWTTAGVVKRSYDVPMRSISPSAAFAPRGSSLAMAAGHTLEFSEADRGARRVSAVKPVQEVYRIAWSPDSRLLAVAGTDVLLVDVAADAVVATWKGNSSTYGLAFSPDGALLAKAGQERSVRLLDVTRFTTPR